jgi:sarcosine oxidase subunit gamma
MIAKSAAHGLTPVSIGGTQLAEAPMAPIWSIAPFHGRADALSAALEAAHGLPFPAPGTLLAAGTTRIAWSGMDQAF